MHISSLRPASLDDAVQGKRGFLPAAWRLVRTVAFDRALYWGLAITVVLPAVFSLFGLDGFAFHGGPITAVALSFTYWFYLMVASIVVGIPCAVLFSKNRKVARNLQRLCFLGTSGFGLWALAHWLPAVLVLSTAGLIAGVVLLTALAEWSIGGGPCANGACELPKK